MEHTPVPCESFPNARAWMSALVGSAVLVFAYALYLNYTAPGQHGFHFALFAPEQPAPMMASAAQTVAWQRPGIAPVRLGVDGLDITPSLAAKLAFPYAGGVFISSVSPGSVADRGGLRRGDVLIALDRQPVQDGRTLVALVSRLRPTQIVSVSVWRSGRTETLGLGL